MYHSYFAHTSPKQKALCLPQTIGSTTGGLVLYCACALKKNPACMLFANHID
ncbi:MAG: DUF126 domain-containing protein, partial [Helicobacter sp.]|nr:DUF126 domain-containing protein [Helicobacter sp.]